MNISTVLRAAVPDKFDSRDYQYSEIAHSQPPANWQQGFDIEQMITDLANNKVPFKLPVKDQGTSGSCGGQAFSTYDAVVRMMHTCDTTERSAKFIYSQVAVPGGGSRARDLGKLLTKQGASPESETPSYDNGNPPSEEFMERTEDITDKARIDARNGYIKNFSISYAYVPLDIDSIAQAIENNLGCVLMVHGQNNGTWLSDNPQPPSQSNSSPIWNHYMYAGKFRINDKGVKQIGCLQSWGKTVGDQGWQWLDEAYFKTMLDLGGPTPAIYAAITLVYNPHPIAFGFTYAFTNDIRYGDTGGEVEALQTILQLEGCFPPSVPITGYYGNITRQAVLAFQQKYKVAPEGELEALQGKLVGPATCAALNLSKNN